MSEEIKYTPGALRAAEIIVSNIATYNELRDVEMMIPPFGKVAECIDRETHLPELVSTLKAIVDCFGLGQSPEKFVEQVSGFIEDARAAIEKANSSTQTEGHQ
jgi:hypothetical protein